MSLASLTISPSSCPAKAGHPVHSDYRERGVYWVTRVRGERRGILRSPWLGAARRHRRERIVRPRVARVASAHLGPYRRIGAAPETRQVARDLHRLVAGREQLDDQRNAPAGDGGGLREPEQLLQPDRYRRASVGLVVDRGARSGRRLEMGRRFGVEAAAQRPREKLGERGVKIAGGELRDGGLVGESRHQPLNICAECRVRQVGPLVAFSFTEEHYTVAPLRQSLGPRQP